MSSLKREPPLFIVRKSERGVHFLSCEWTLSGQVQARRMLRRLNGSVLLSVVTLGSFAHS